MKFKWITPLLAATMMLAPTAANAAVWSSSAQYGSYSSGAYSWNNDVFGSGAGPQTIWVNSTSQWGAWSQQPNTNGVKAYPHEGIYFGQAINSMTKLQAGWNQTPPSSGVWDFAFDIWDTNNSHEIMVWTDWKNAKPISYTWDSTGNPVPKYYNVCVGWSCWNVYEGTNGSNAVISFVRTSTNDNASVDLKAILQWAESTGYFGNLTIGSVQYGVEVTSTNNTGENFNFNNYWVSWQ